MSRGRPLQDFRNPKHSRRNQLQMFKLVREDRNFRRIGKIVEYSPVNSTLKGYQAQQENLKLLCDKVCEFVKQSGKAGLLRKVIQEAAVDYLFFFSESFVAKTFRDTCRAVFILLNWLYRVHEKIENDFGPYVSEAYAEYGRLNQILVVLCSCGRYRENCVGEILLLACGKRVPVEQIKTFLSSIDVKIHDNFLCFAKKLLENDGVRNLKLVYSSILFWEQKCTSTKQGRILFGNIRAHRENAFNQTQKVLVLKDENEKKSQEIQQKTREIEVLKSSCASNLIQALKEKKKAEAQAKKLHAEKVQLEAEKRRVERELEATRERLSDLLISFPCSSAGSSEETEIEDGEITEMEMDDSETEVTEDFQQAESEITPLDVELVAEPRGYYEKDGVVYF